MPFSISLYTHIHRERAGEIETPCLFYSCIHIDRDSLSILQQFQRQRVPLYSAYIDRYRCPIVHPDMSLYTSESERLSERDCLSILHLCVYIYTEREGERDRQLESLYMYTYT